MLDNIKRLLILLVTKGKTTQENVEKCLGIGRTQVNNLLMGIEKNKKETKSNKETTQKVISNGNS